MIYSEYIKLVKDLTNKAMKEGDPNQVEVIEKLAAQTVYALDTSKAMELIHLMNTEAPEFISGAFEDLMEDTDESELRYFQFNKLLACRVIVNEVSMRVASPKLYPMD